MVPCRNILKHNRCQSPDRFLQRLRHFVLTCCATGIIALNTGCDRQTWEGIAETPATSILDGITKAGISAVLAITDEKSPTFKLTCEAIGLSAVEGNNAKTDLGSFSVSFPSATGWCLLIETKYIKGFAKSPFVGRVLSAYPSKEHLKNSFILQAANVEARPDQVERAGGLLKLASQWIENGMSLREGDHGYQVDMRISKRFRMIDQKVIERQIQSTECLEYVYEVDEHDNPNAGGRTMRLQVDGMVCKDRMATNRLMLLQFSERYIRGYQVNHTLYNMLLEHVAKPFFASIEIKTPN